MIDWHKRSLTFLELVSRYREAKEKKKPLGEFLPMMKQDVNRTSWVPVNKEHRRFQKWLIDNNEI